MTISGVGRRVVHSCPDPIWAGPLVVCHDHLDPVILRRRASASRDFFSRVKLMADRNGLTMPEPPGDFTIELEPEVRAWLETLAPPDYRTVERFADRLAADGGTLPFPLSSHLGDGLRELRIGAIRVTYWLAPRRRAVLLTVFRKTKMRETDEVLRAQRARKRCEAEHPPACEHDVYSRGEEV